MNILDSQNHTNDARWAINVEH